MRKVGQVLFYRRFSRFLSEHHWDSMGKYRKLKLVHKLRLDNAYKRVLSGLMAHSQTSQCLQFFHRLLVDLDDQFMRMRRWGPRSIWVAVLLLTRPSCGCAHCEMVLRGKGGGCRRLSRRRTSRHRVTSSTGRLPKPCCPWQSRRVLLITCTLLIVVHVPSFIIFSDYYPPSILRPLSSRKIFKENVNNRANNGSNKVSNYSINIDSMDWEHEIMCASRD